ncbi:MAG: metallophosphoesterase family protein, partial [Verrucomicrobiota bacterium]
MRYAIFSDIHGNLPAWERVLADLRSLQADVLICLGDVVGYGPKPEEVLGGIRSVTDHFVLGNHDAAAAGIIDPDMFNDHAKSVVLWTREQLSADSLQFLNDVPLELETPDLLFVHAEVPEPGRFGYIVDEDDARASFAARDHFVTFVGHTHHPECFERLPTGLIRKMGDAERELDPNCRYIINVGSVGEPRDPREIKARYVIYDSDTRQVYFRRIDFDTDRYREELGSTSLTHAPYFLHALDHQDAEVETQDMQVLAHAASGLLSKRRALVVPDSVARQKPKPRPAPAGRGANQALTISLIVSSLLLIAGMGYWFFLREEEEDAVVSALQDVLPGVTEILDEPAGEIGAERGEVVVASRSGERVEASPEETVDKAAKMPLPKVVSLASTRSPSSPSVAPTAVASPSTSEVVPAASPPQMVPKKEESIRFWFDMDTAPSAVGALTDRSGTVTLANGKPGKPFSPIAPTVIPYDKRENLGAIASGAWKEEEPSGQFSLRGDRSFTFEGWVMMAPGKRPYRIAGTNDGEVGWCVDMKPAEEVEGPGIARFFYQNGEHQIAAMSTEVGFYQTGAHHFAAVWNHQEGTMSFYFDQELIDQAALSPGAIASGKPLPFYIGTKKNPKSIGVDEFRFTQEALHPRRFLTGSSRQSVDLPRPVVAFDASQPEPFHEWDVQGDIKDPSLTKYQLGGLPTLFLNGNAFLQRKAVLNRGDDTFTFVALFSPHRLAGKQRICDQAQRG